MVTAATNLGANAAKRYLEINTSKAIRATEELASGSRASNPSYDPSASAVSYRLTAVLQAYGQSSRNVSQATAMIQMATGALGATQDVLTRMKALTVAANSDTIGAQDRAMFNEEFQQLLNQVDLNAQNARWGGISLFTGGGGTVSDVGITAEGATGLTTVANAFANTFTAANYQGLFSGIATDAQVRQNGSNYDVSVTVGTQTFKATVLAPVGGGNLTLVSTTDPANAISFVYDAAVTAIVDAASFQTSLRGLLGVDTATKAAFSSLGTSATGMPNVTLSSGSGTAAGTWALTYQGSAAGGTGTFKISRGDQYYTATVTTTAAMTQTVSFDNGITLSLAAFDGTANAAQELYNISAGTAITQQFQYGEKSSDVLSITFSGATASVLGLSGLNVLTADNASTAADRIDLAMQQIGGFIGQLGGKASQLSFVNDTLQISTQNQAAARSTFIDANIAQAMQESQKFRGLADVAGTVFTQSLNDANKLAQLVGNVR